MDNVASLFGFLGAITASSLFFPQVWASYKTKRTHDLAWPFIATGILNAIFWMIYGFLKSDPFVYVTNTIIFIGVLLLAVLKKKHG
ncbi:MAG: SemiSWEET family transporter [Candidatus Wildermuthbacteria bacterium]|nr:SemiSWEET family transporter [Candidatus Wildermuthbacteria bacterium]